MDQFCQNLISTWYLYLYNLYIAIITSKGIGLGTNGSVICMLSA